MSDFFNNKSLYIIINKWKYHLLIITIIGGAFGLGMSFWLKPEYNSFAIVYPVNIAPYSDESNTEQMLQVLQSRDIKDKVISSFNLINHYSIDTVKKDYINTLYYVYDKNINIKKTEYESINIICSDNDPETAKLIVDSIIQFYNQKQQNLYRIKIKEVMNVAKVEFNKWKSIQDSINGILSTYREKYGIQDYEIQLRAVTNGIYRTNNKKLSKEGQAFLDVLEKYGVEYDMMLKKYEQASDEVLKANIAYNKALKEYNKDITYSQIISKPFVSFKKSHSKKILIILLGMLSSFMLSLFIIAFLEKINK